MIENNKYEFWDREITLPETYISDDDKKYRYGKNCHYNDSFEYFDIFGKNGVFRYIVMKKLILISQNNFFNKYTLKIE